MFKKILVANRGAIAARIIRTLKNMNIAVVAIYSEADQHLPYLKLADETYELKGSIAKDTYLNQDRIIEIVKISGVDGVHPGYGFLAENSEFSKRLEEMGVKFIGPST
ncbi:biotin carboxylase, partial [Butyricicoccus sp. 1XD8-22]